MKSGAYDLLEKVTGRQDDKPINRWNSQGNIHAREDCCWRKRSLQQHSACDYTGEQPQQQLCLRNNPNKDLKKEDTTKPGIWTNVLPVGNHATLGRALRYSWVSFQYCECSLRLKQYFWKIYLFKTMTFYQFKTCKTFVELKQIRVQIIG